MDEYVREKIQKHLETIPEGTPSDALARISSDATRGLVEMCRAAYNVDKDVFCLLLAGAVHTTLMDCCSNIDEAIALNKKVNVLVVDGFVKVDRIVNK